MATNQMEEGRLLKQRDRALAAIIERYPKNDIFIDGDGIALRVFASEGSSGLRVLDGKTYGPDWDDLTQYTMDMAYYSEPLPDNGYYWIDKTYRRDWFLYSI